MAITDAALLAEIQNDPAGLGFAGAGANPITQRLNAPGSAQVQAWVVASTDRPVEKEKFLQLLTLAEAAAIQSLMDGATPTGQALKFKLTQSASIDMSKATNRGFMSELLSGNIVSQDTHDAMLRLGEVEQSRAQELWNEAVTIDQVRGVL
jgi:hypothetical protein